VATSATCASRKTFGEFVLKPNVANHKTTTNDNTDDETNPEHCELPPVHD
jgi:hypothetical protein